MPKTFNLTSFASESHSNVPLQSSTALEATLPASLPDSLHASRIALSSDFLSYKFSCLSINALICSAKRNHSIFKLKTIPNSPAQSGEHDRRDEAQPFCLHCRDKYSDKFRRVVRGINIVILKGLGKKHLEHLESRPRC